MTLTRQNFRSDFLNHDLIMELDVIRKNVGTTNVDRLCANLRMFSFKTLNSEISYPENHTMFSSI